MINTPSSLSGQLTWLYAISYGLVLIIALLSLYLSINFILNKRIAEDLEEDVDELTAYFNTRGLDQLLEEIDRESETGASDEFFIALFNTEQKLVASSDLSEWPLFTELLTPLFTQRTEQGADIFTLQFADADYPAKVILAPLSSELTIAVGESTAEKMEILNLLKLILAFIAAIALPLIAVTGWMITNRKISGIEAVIKTAETINSSALDKRVAVDDNCSEVQRLSSTFNAMLDRIHTLIKEMREITDNVAHDLRSPLARIRAIAETALADDSNNQSHKETAARTIEECDRLLELINTTLDIAELEARTAKFTLHRSEINSIVRDVCELYEPLAEQQKITLTTRCLNEDCFVDIDATSFQRAIANLLDNAIKYSPEQSAIVVNVQCQAPFASIEVTDQGLGINEAEKERIFERFYRCDQSRSTKGCGLGLSYVKAVALAHGGKIALSSQPGMGSTFIFSLPRAQNPLL